MTKRGVRVVYVRCAYCGRITQRTVREMGRMGPSLVPRCSMSSSHLCEHAARRRVHFIGTRSLLLIIFTGAFTGMCGGFSGLHRAAPLRRRSLSRPGVGLSLIASWDRCSRLNDTARAGSRSLQRSASCASRADRCARSDGAQPDQISRRPHPVGSAAHLPAARRVFSVVGVYGGFLVGVKLLVLVRVPIFRR